MSLICGYFSTRGTLTAAAIEERVRSFSPMPSMCAAQWPFQSYYSAYGGLLAKFKRDGPARVSAGVDVAGNTLLLFGMHDFADPYLQREPHERTLPTDDLLRRLEGGEGEFTAALMEPSGVIHLINDRFAAQPCYLYQDRGNVLFSSNLTLLQRLIGGPPVFDKLGVLQMFTYYHTLGHRTIVEGTRKLGPAVHVTIGGQGVVERAYNRFAPHVEEGMDPVALAEEAWDAFLQSSRLRHQGRKGLIPLSGGLDSRLIAASVSPENFISFTRNESLNDQPTREARTAIAIAQRLNLRHDLRPFPRDEFSKVALDLAMLISGMVPMNHAIKNIFMVGAVREAGGFYMGGASGGTMAGAYVPTLDYAFSPWNEPLMRHFSRLVTRQPRGSLALVFRKPVLREWYPRLEPSLRDTFEATEGPTAAHRATMWGMTIRQPSFAFQTMAHNHPEVMSGTPHLGYRYSDLMLRLPATWLYKRNFYKFMVYHNLPKLRDVIYFNTGELLSEHVKEYEPGAKPAHNRKHWGKHWSLRRWARWVLPPEVLRPLRILRTHREKPYFYHQIMACDKKLHTTARETLHSYSALGELFDVPRCEQLLASLAAGHCHSYTKEMDVCLIGGLLSACYFYHGLCS